MFSTFALLGAAIACVWLPSAPIPPWAVLYAGAVVAGLSSGVLTWPAIIAVLAMAGLCMAARHGSGRSGQVWMWMWAAGAFSLALALHVLPGFHNPRLLDAVRTSEQATPFTLYANFDKASAGLFLLVFFAPRLGSLAALRASAAPALIGCLMTATVTIGLAWATGHVRPDMKVPPFTAMFLAINLLFTCVAEEAFFRGLVQERLTLALRARQGWRWAPPMVSALLFAMAHAGGGALFAAVVGLAGLGYALVYARTRCIEAAVLTHFLVNATHFLFFTYPALAS